MPKHFPNGGAAQPLRVLHPGRGDTFGTGHQVGAKGIPASDHKNGGTYAPQPPRRR